MPKRLPCKPQQLLRAIGWRGWLLFYLMIGGMLLSSLLHPLILFFKGNVQDGGTGKLVPLWA